MGIGPRRKPSPVPTWHMYAVWAQSGSLGAGSRQTDRQTDRRRVRQTSSFIYNMEPFPAITQVCLLICRFGSRWRLSGWLCRCLWVLQCVMLHWLWGRRWCKDVAVNIYLLKSGDGSRHKSDYANINYLLLAYTAIPRYKNESKLAKKLAYNIYIEET